MKFNKEEYINTALKRVEIFEDTNSYCGSIPAISGVWAQAKTKEDMLIELQEALEVWLNHRLKIGLDVPNIKLFCDIVDS